MLRPRGRSEDEFEIVARPPEGLTKTVRVTHLKTGTARICESDYPTNPRDKQFAADLDAGVF